MNLSPNSRGSTFSASGMMPVFLFVAGVAFSVVIWILQSFWMPIIGTPPANYYVSMPYAGLSYVTFCWLIFSGFMVIGLILLLCGKRRLFSLALILSCLSICANTLLMKATLRKGHLYSMQCLVQGLQEFDPNDQDAWMFLLNHEALTRDIARWNEVENEQFVPEVDLVSVVGDWFLETEGYTGVCRFDCGDYDWIWRIEFDLEINGEVWAEAEYLPIKNSKEDGLYKIILCNNPWLYKRGHSYGTNLISSLDEGVYLEMAQDKQSFFMYPDETKEGLCLGPFIRK